MVFERRRWAALTVKEFRQLKKNRQLIFQLLFPPTVALLVFGFALNPEVKGLRLGVADYSRSPQSRELVDVLTANRAVRIEGWFLSAGAAEQALRRRELDLALVVPEDYAERLKRGQPAEVQVLIDAVNANSANIAAAYLSLATAAGARARLRRVEPVSRIYFNPGSIHAWYYVTGSLCLILFINSSLVASALAVREKEIGTIEQLLMSPAQTLEILLAKTAPVLVLMMGVFALGLTVGMTVFGIPQRGSWVLLAGAVLLLLVAGIGVGVTLATFAASQQQAQLMTFFLIPPAVLVSGAFAPIEGMPVALQYLSVASPIRYLVKIVQGVMLKGAGIDVLWPQVAALAAFSVILFGLSAWRFRGQLK